MTTHDTNTGNNTGTTGSAAIVAQAPLTRSPWPTLDPFLFCAHHVDNYPAGDENMGPQAALTGRRIGMDFDNRDGWNMYHGDVVPGFPQHPHRGFETISIARQGLIDHHDSMGAAARFGNGDVQWMTAGDGVVHSEMFPLVNTDAPNPMELFQIWLNLPSVSKRSPAYFTMFWDADVPRRSVGETGAPKTEVTVVAGRYDDLTPLSSPPDSWASNSDADVRVWTLKMEPGATWTLPAGAADASRVLYWFAGARLSVDGVDIDAHSAVQLDPSAEVVLKNGDTESELLLLHGRPIGEPVVQQGPFVMNTADEIQQTVREYQRTQFGGWPFKSNAPVHPRTQPRFARHADGREEVPGAAAQQPA